MNTWNLCPKLPKPYFIMWVLIFILVAMAWVLALQPIAHASEVINAEKLANAIYKAEGGVKTSHPYGILVHYKITTPRQACINTIRHAQRDWNGCGDFIAYLQKRYAPLGVSNDPDNLNRNWLKNVSYFYGIFGVIGYGDCSLPGGVERSLFQQEMLAQQQNYPQTVFQHGQNCPICEKQRAEVKLKLEEVRKEQEIKKTNYQTRCKAYMENFRKGHKCL